MRLMRLNEVMDATGLARSTVYKYVAAGKFPEPVPLGGRSVAWVQDEVDNWILARIEERDGSRGCVPEEPTPASAEPGE